MPTLLKQSSIRINALSGWAAFGANAVLAFLITPLLTRHLGSTGYGIWTLVYSFVGYYGLVNLGVNSAVTRYVARYAGQGDSTAVNEVVGSALAMFSCTGAVVVILSLGLSQPLAQFFHIAPDQLAVFRWVVWIVGLVTALGFPTSVLSTALTAHEHFVAANVANVAIALLRGALTVAAVLAGKGLLGLAVAALFVQVVGLVLFYALCRRLTPHVVFRISSAKLRVLKTLLVYGGVSTIISVSDIMRGNLGSFIVGRKLDVASAGIYNIALTLTQYVATLVTVAIGVLAPRFAALEGRGDFVGTRTLFLKSLRVASFLSFGAYTAVAVLSQPFIMWWVGRTFAGAAPAVWILAFSCAFGLAQNPAIVLMYAVNKHKYYALATVLEAAANVSLSIFLVRSYGILGVALGAAIPMTIVKVIVMPAYVAPIAGVTGREYVGAVVPGALGAIFALGASWGIGALTWLPKTILGITALGLWLTVTYIAFAGALYLIGHRSQSWRQYLQQAAR